MPPLRNAWVLRARAENALQVGEVVLSGSPCQGPPVRIACNRPFLRRVVQLGFCELLLRNATPPLLCREDRRTSLFMPLAVRPRHQVLNHTNVTSFMSSFAFFVQWPKVCSSRDLMQWVLGNILGTGLPI
jgi:hypothetical protein